jgi:hypothetical protein
VNKLKAIFYVLAISACSHDPPPASSAPTASATPSAISSVAPSASSAEQCTPKPPVAENLPATWERTPDIEFVPTPQNVVDKMLEVAEIKKDDVLYDLGCGDGRIPVTASKQFKIKTIGFDLDPVRVHESRENVRKNCMEDFVTIELKDVFKVDLSPATVVTLYLLPALNVKLIPQLEKLKPGSRIVTHDFDMKGVEPEKTWTVVAPDHRPPHKDREHYVYLFRTPLKKKK